jgi:hypothetical protein
MRPRLLGAIALAACSGTAVESRTPVANRAVVGPPGADSLELVAACATEAVELLGWNPLPDGAHLGMVLRTAAAYGGSARCASLATDANVRSFDVGGRQVDWDWGPKDQPEATTIHFVFSCRGCTPVETEVSLPRRWHCFGWIHGMQHGTGCAPDHAACEATRLTFATTSPCELRTGAAWCLHPPSTVCTDTPWACARQPGGGPCDRVP